MTQTQPFFKELKAHRESQNIEISEISERTKINPRFLQAIESGDFSVLPSVYLRLFLRSYAIEIGFDPDKTLNDFELYTTGTISETTIKQTEIDEIKTKPSSEDYIGDDVTVSSLSQKKILGIIALMVAIFFLFKFLNHLTNETSPSTASQQIQLVHKDTVLSDSLKIDTNNSFPGTQYLVESLFSNEKLIKQDSKKLLVTAPFSFYLTANTKTIVHIKTNDVDYNSLIDAGFSREFTFSDTLLFDLWDAKHVGVKINNVNITPFLLLEGSSAIRGSIVSDGSISVTYFKH